MGGNSHLWRSSTLFNNSVRPQDLWLDEVAVRTGYGLLVVVLSAIGASREQNYLATIFDGRNEESCVCEYVYEYGEIMIRQLRNR